jgi:hypothetical protein
MSHYDATESLRNCRFLITNYLEKHPSAKRAVNALLAHPNLEGCVKPQAPTPKQIRHSDATRAGIVEALKEGERNMDIARAYGVSTTYVTKLRAKAGLPSKRTWGVGERSKLAREANSSRHERGGACSVDKTQSNL